jgi:hypothetical protein
MRFGKTALGSALVVLAVAASSSAATAPPQWRWSESHAEAVVMAKVRIPYCNVYPSSSQCPEGPNAIGFQLQSADCTGAGEYRATFTYTRFTCKIVVYNGYAKGRIAVYPTGRSTLRWKIL